MYGDSWSGHQDTKSREKISEVWILLNLVYAWKTEENRWAECVGTTVGRTVDKVYPK